MSDRDLKKQQIKAFPNNSLQKTFGFGSSRGGDDYTHATMCHDNSQQEK